ncbi:MAG: PA0069 family radical SAM protein [Gammaproteobacteria bacterium]|nr:PA0069 family radical SAM protein [Gammaproteobacteria bacterium]MBU6509497.1 PA0069 family radical SAM protein [Gammaproteobacteria bacterium]MDE1984489.1 PA0069 family radical SAM protein [Gammaproteobacteria bacterium]MDE2109312.1 PA0069 family radical SAM protein [Gammaproteobacteria bacterium]
MPNPPRIPEKGRGALSNPEGRFETQHRENFDDGWDREEEPLPPFETTVTPEPARSIISRNQSPDIPFEQSINPYRGCEHGCIYCFARPSHAYVNLSPGLDFETKLFYKEHAAELLEQELRKPSYRPSPITLGANTDPYQPIERKLKVTRSILEVLQRFHHPVSIITKSTLVARDLDILADMARLNLASVMVSITTLDENLKRSLEPRAAGPWARLRTLRALAAQGVPVGVLNAPIIPVVNDREIEQILELAAEAGACCAGYVLLRLPYEVKDLFKEWLDAHLPERAAHVMSIIRQMRGGKDYQSGFGTRMRGTGEYAELIARRFALACRKFNLQHGRRTRLSTAHFRPPAAGPQLDLGL